MAEKDPIIEAEAQMDYELALNAVAEHAKSEGYQIAGGEKNLNAPYSLVFQNASGYTAVKVTTTRAPEQPTYTTDHVRILRSFATQNNIGNCAMAPVSLISAGAGPDGREGFYVKYNGLELI